MIAKAIFKYPLDARGEQQVMMPEGARVLSVQEQGGVICLWAMVETDRPFKTVRTFQIYGTGHSIPDGLRHRVYVGTVQTEGGSLVWHVFELV
jgi:hypothetical protein